MRSCLALGLEAGEGSGLEQGLNLEVCGWLLCRLPLGFLSWSWGLGSSLEGDGMALGSVPSSPGGQLGGTGSGDQAKKTWMLLHRTFSF